MLQALKEDLHRISDRPSLTSDQKEAVVVLFVSLPGLRKTELCEALEDDLASVYNVYHLDTNKMPVACKTGRKYWQHVANLAESRSTDGRPTVILAHKNLLNSPPGASTNHVLR
jgi:hypothetical protein